MTIRLGSYPTRAHRKENLQLILNRDHPDYRAEPPATWLLVLRERVLRSAGGWNPQQAEAQRAEIRRQREQAMADIRLARHAINAAQAKITNRMHLLSQLEIEEQILDAPR